MYTLTWKNPAVDSGKINISVPVATTVSNAASIIFTGKGSANYGKIQQENLMRLLENFADSTAPNYATVGQLWYDTSAATLRVLTDSNPVSWKSVGGIQVSDAADGPPANPNIGDLWFEKTGALSGYLYVYNKIGRFPYSTTAVGGWSQIWPRVDAAGLRFEYDEIFGLTETLLTQSVIDSLFPNVPAMVLLDTSMQSIVSSSPDLEIERTGVASAIKVTPVSYDWDAVLSAARWAVSRLDVPLNTWDDVSSFPFVQDGRQVRGYLVESYASQAIDVRSTPAARRSGGFLGSITLHRLYTETVNVLRSVQPFKYTLRGIAGASGTNSSFAPDVATHLHCRRAGNWTGGSAVSAVTNFRWNDVGSRDRFISGGNAVELTVTLNGGSGTANTQLNTFLNSVGRVRITADMVRWLNNAEPPVMTASPSNNGLLTAVENAASQQLGTQTDGSNTLTVLGQSTSTGFTLTVTVNAPSGISGELQVTFGIVKDRTIFDNTEADLYASPLAYQTSDSTGTSAILANVSLTAPPVANFTVNGTTGTNEVVVSAGSTVTFAWTGTGNPTLIEWDFDGSGIFTATGPIVSTTYSSTNRYSPRVRATNAGGNDVVCKSAKVRVT